MTSAAPEGFAVHVIIKQPGDERSLWMESKPEGRAQGVQMQIAFFA